MSENKAKFLFESIKDMQGTIRAVDFKISVLMLVLTIPLTLFHEIHKSVSERLSNWPGLGSAILVIFLGSWFLSLAVSLRALTSIDDPSEHITGERPTGSFYVGYLFTTGFVDCLWNRWLQSSKTVQEHYAALPADEHTLLKELGYEQMKLAYIRSIKIVRQKYAFFFFIVWILSGCALWFLHS